LKEITKKQALQKSIFKWEWLRDNLINEESGNQQIRRFIKAFPEFDEYTVSCPLCHLYNDELNGGYDIICYKCPIHNSIKNGTHIYCKDDEVDKSLFTIFGENCDNVYKLRCINSMLRMMYKELKKIREKE
jgi:hypothetical protein